MGIVRELKPPFMQDRDERDFITHFIIPNFYPSTYFFFSSPSY
jgi:hypothetical protein